MYRAAVVDFARVGELLAAAARNLLGVGLVQERLVGGKDGVHRVLGAGHAGGEVVEANGAAHFKEAVGDTETEAWGSVVKLDNGGANLGGRVAVHGAVLVAADGLHVADGEHLRRDDGGAAVGRLGHADAEAAGAVAGNGDDARAANLAHARLVADGARHQDLAVERLDVGEREARHALDLAVLAELVLALVVGVRRAVVAPGHAGDLAQLGRLGRLGPAHGEARGAVLHHLDVRRRRLGGVVLDGERFQRPLPLGVEGLVELVHLRLGQPRRRVVPVCRVRDGGVVLDEVLLQHRRVRLQLGELLLGHVNHVDALRRLDAAQRARHGPRQLRVRLAVGQLREARRELVHPVLLAEPRVLARLLALLLGHQVVARVQPRVVLDVRRPVRVVAYAALDQHVLGVDGRLARLDGLHLRGRVLAAELLELRRAVRRQVLVGEPCHRGRLRQAHLLGLDVAEPWLPLGARRRRAVQVSSARGRGHVDGSARWGNDALAQGAARRPYNAHGRGWCFFLEWQLVQERE